ncbi:MAG: phosphoribosylformylglycinamidine synthase subunit PurL, partial [Candidatus Eisenbacteria bacterium]|nr:phosphoribosylformylglycinamidine synthase subunit PurL [Candidatus Eisenbacteria bacterium]
MIPNDDEARGVAPLVRIRGRSPEEVRAENARWGLGLSYDEWQHLMGRLDRDPLLPEAFLLDVSLSEHCSYKSSRPFLKRHLPPQASHVLLGPGEDAGIVSLGTWNGEEWGLVVAHESHNHPSQVLPIEGAATGIGGIVRDVYCMGCDVVGVLDPLRFGDPDGPNGDRVRAIARGVIQGISEYGNALGVPNLGGDVWFHEGFDDNCLVNVVAFGAMPMRRLLRSRVPAAARDRTYVLILVGKPTDSTGLGGASFASQILDEAEAAQNRGAVQVHDPFLKRVLVEATKEVWEWLEAEKIEAGCKDLGAGGLGGASSELVLAGGFGADIDLDRVPRSDEPLLPHQILCGETQERFVWAIPEEHAGTFLSIFNERYELGRVYPGARAAVIGTVIAESVYRARWEGAVVCELSAAILEESPIAPRPIAPRTQAAPVRDPGSPGDWSDWLRGQLGGWNAAARAPIYRSYDQEVQGHALFRPGEADAGVCRPISGAALGIAVSVDGNPEYGSLDPYWGGVLSVLESARNVAAVGAEPLAITDCLNFGNPEDAVCLGDLDAALRGMADACRALGSPGHPDEPLPIVSGNVSLYNQSSRGRAIPPSPIVACFGILPDYGRAVPQRLCRTGDTLLLVGARARHWGRPERAAGGRVPDRPLADQVTEIRTVQSLAADGSLAACHDVSDGGILRTLFEMA